MNLLKIWAYHVQQASLKHKCKILKQSSRPKCIILKLQAQDPKCIILKQASLRVQQQMGECRDSQAAAARLSRDKRDLIERQREFVQEDSGSYQVQQAQESCSGQ
jgi:hypothetical protein